jgi:hypothetical protein
MVDGRPVLPAALQAEVWGATIATMICLVNPPPTTMNVPPNNKNENLVCGKAHYLDAAMSRMVALPTDP